MHIPDAYLSPSTEACAWSVMVPLWALALKKTRTELSSRQLPLLSFGAAFCFAIQMLNIPALGGTTVHALGTVLLAILLGPWAAIIAVTLTLAIQALFFGDGGVLALGANALNMAVVSAFVGSWTYRLCAGCAPPGSRRALISGTFASYLGTVGASVSAGVLLGIQPILAHDTAGHALYFPLALNVSVPAMAIIHLAVAGPAEAIITGVALAYLWKNFPELCGPRNETKAVYRRSLAKSLAFVVMLTPLGLLAGGSAWGEWDSLYFRHLVGYIPSGIEHSEALVKPLMPDYGFAGINGGIVAYAGYALSALVGILLLFFASRLIRGKNPAPSRSYSHRPQPYVLPEWMRQPNDLPLLTGRCKAAKWLSGSLRNLEGTVGRVHQQADSARLQGLLQSWELAPKSLAALGILLVIGLGHSPFLLAIIIACSLLLAWRSLLPVRPFVMRVTGATLLFGLPIVLSLYLYRFEPETTGFVVHGGTLGFHSLSAASLVLLRIAAGISITLLWSSTTRWNRLVDLMGKWPAARFFAIAVGLAYRYLFVLCETLHEMIVARISRQAGNLSKGQAEMYCGTGAAILFAKSISYSELVHEAMRSRGADCVPTPMFTPSRPPVRMRWLTLFTGLTFFVLLMGVSNAI